LWTASGLSVAHKTAKFITLWTLLEWKLLVVIEKRAPKKTLHKQGRKEGSLYSYVFHTLTLLPHISSPFVKLPHVKHLKIS
jgi:hypothetical protein